MNDLADRVIALLRRHPSVDGAVVAGSRSTGATTELSDLDIEVETDDVDGFVEAVPRLVEELEPLGHQWDPLSDHWCYMVMMPGPVKIDIIVYQPFQVRGPWVPSAGNLAQIEHHFWDWTLWLGSKELRGEDARVRSELEKMFGHLLRPLGVASVPGDLTEAIESYRGARDRAEEVFGVRVDRKMEGEVLNALRGTGLVTT